MHVHFTALLDSDILEAEKEDDDLSSEDLQTSDQSPSADNNCDSTNQKSETKTVETATQNAPKLPSKKKKKISNFEKGISMLCSHFNEASEKEMEWLVSNEFLWLILVIVQLVYDFS